MKFDKNRIHKKHKQSKYITIMLVPECSTSKVKSLKVGRWVWYTLGIGSTFIVTALTLSSLKIVKFDDVLSSVESELKNKDAINSELISKNKEFSTSFENEKSNYENQLQSLEEKAKQVETQLKELEKTKQDIYDKISSKNIPINQYDINNPETAMGGPIISLAQTNSKQAIINSKFDSLMYSLDVATSEFSELSEKINTSMPYLNAYPSILPVDGNFTSYVGYRSNPFSGYSGTEYHSGLDIKTDKGTDVKATGSGVVTFSGYSGSYGYLVTIDHGYDIETRYGHNSSLLVEVGDTVKRGDIIAKSGSTGRSTGPHVHYEIRLNNEVQNPFDYVKED